MTHATYLDAAVTALRRMRLMQATADELRRKHTGIPIVHAHHVARQEAIGACIDLLKAELDDVRLRPEVAP